MNNSDVYESMTHRFLSEAFYIVMMNKVNKDRNTNSCTLYNLELFIIFIFIIVYNIHKNTIIFIKTQCLL